MFTDGNSGVTQRIVESEAAEMREVRRERTLESVPDPNGTELSRIFDADGICASWGHAFEK